MTDAYTRMMSMLDEDSSREDYIRAPFGYPGAKTKSLGHILPHLPHRLKYIEPFGGSAVVLLNRPKSDVEAYNDRFGGCVSFYRCLRDKDKLASLLEKIELSIHAREEFVFCKKTWTNVQDDVERAYRWYYLNQMSFVKKGTAFARATNSKSNLGNVLRARVPGFWDIHARIKNVIIENQSWEQMVKDFDSEEAVFYMDPPYLDTSSGLYTHEMTTLEHKHLLETIFTMKGFVALSGYPNKMYDSFPWDDCHKWKIRNTMGSQASTSTNNLKEGDTRRDLETECLWVKE